MKKPIYVLGINESHCATSALSKNGELIACVSEERFTKIKNQSGFPKNAINYCLNYAGIKSKDLDSVSLSFLHPMEFGKASSLSNTSIILQKIMNIDPQISFFTYKVREFIYQSLFYKSAQKKHTQGIARKLKLPITKINLVDHQTAHAYSAYYASPIRHKKSLVITNDGSGDFVCSRIFTVLDGNWKEIAQTPNHASLGLIYYYVTKYLGMKPNEHEYKVMGLSAYTKPVYSKQVLKIFEGIMEVDSLTLKTKIPHVFLEKYLEKALKGFRFDQIAGGVQAFTEKVLINLVKNAIKKTGIRNIYLAGGVFMNVKANMLIANLAEVESIFVMPSSADESSAIGTMYYPYPHLNKPISNIYLGPKPAVKNINKYFDKKQYLVKKMVNPSKVIAKLIAKGEIIARCAGRMEFGQRALGNRSILARADKTDVIKVINEQIKGRDFWMPFAPVILKERVSDYLINPKSLDSKYMMMAFETTPLAQKELIAGLHAYDLTTRPQIISESDNPEYYKIVKEFEKLTGIGGILNTSFNLHGFPIVNTTEDAVNTFKGSGLKYLVLENYLIKKL